jgi:hypothetical protein
MDSQRNLHEFVSARKKALDQFAPGWRDKVDTTQSQAKVRGQILEYWLSLIRALDMQPSQGIERVVGSYVMDVVGKLPLTPALYRKGRGSRPS